MASHQVLNKLNNKIYTKEICTMPNIMKESKDIQLLKNLNDKIKVLDSNKLTLHSSQESHEIAELTNNITELEIHNNYYIEFYKILSHFTNLKKLFLNNSMIESLHNDITELQNLNVLNLSHNQLKELPNNLINLKHLEVLDLSHNKLSNLPVCYKQLQHIKHIDISNNNFSTLPKCIANGMGTLRVLNISENFHIMMNVIPYSKHLQIFYAKKNKYCETFPNWILTTKFFNLKELYFNETTFNTSSFISNDGDLSIEIFSMPCSNLTNPILEKMIKNMFKLKSMLVIQMNSIHLIIYSITFPYMY
jgi:Leucine-rich repeat (LRR) protein